MKKIVLPLMCLLLAFVAGCGKDTKSKGNAADGGITVDVDLSAMNSNMTMAALNNIYMAPKDFIGKTIRLNGRYASEYNQNAGTIQHFLLVGSGDDCCVAWVRAVLNSSFINPGDYPSERSWVRMTGVFDRIEEDGYAYYCLSISDIAQLN
jgi:hypothetical protein